MSTKPAAEGSGETDRRRRLRDDVWTGVRGGVAYVQVLWLVGWPMFVVLAWSKGESLGRALGQSAVLIGLMTCCLPPLVVLIRFWGSRLDRYLDSRSGPSPSEEARTADDVPSVNGSPSTLGANRSR